MSQELIEASRRLTKQYLELAQAMDLTARLCGEPRRSYWKRRAKAVRDHAKAEEQNLKEYLKGR